MCLTIQDSLQSPHISFLDVLLDVSCTRFGVFGRPATPHRLRCRRGLCCVEDFGSLKHAVVTSQELSQTRTSYSNATCTAENGELASQRLTQEVLIMAVFVQMPLVASPACNEILITSCTSFVRKYHSEILYLGRMHSIQQYHLRKGINPDRIRADSQRNALPRGVEHHCGAMPMRCVC